MRWRRATSSLLRDLMIRRLSWDKKNLEPLRPGLSVGVSGLVTNESYRETVTSNISVSCTDHVLSVVVTESFSQIVEHTRTVLLEFEVTRKILPRIAKVSTMLLHSNIVLITPCDYCYQWILLCIQE